MILLLVRPMESRLVHNTRLQIHLFLWEVAEIRIVEAAVKTCFSTLLIDSSNYFHFINVKQKCMNIQTLL